MSARSTSPGRPEPAILSYTVAGALTGLLTVLGTWWIDLARFQSEWTVDAIWAMHMANPALWILDTLPLLMGMLFGRGGFWKARIRRAQEEHAMLRSILNSVDGVILLFNSRGHIVQANAGMTRITGYAPAEMIGRTVWDEAMQGSDAEQARQLVEAGDTSPFPYRLEGIWQTRSGRRRRLGWTVNPVPLAGRGEQLFLATGIDLSEYHLLHERLTDQVSHDPLTGLANRDLLLTQAQRALELVPDTTALLTVDLDNFKALNHQHGHISGDRVLRVISKRLLDATRGSDTVARLEGDSFVVLLENAGTTDAATVVVHRLLSSISKPIQIGVLEVSVTASVGVAMGRTERAAEDLLRNSNTATYLAKREGKGRHVVFEPAMHAQMSERIRLESEIQRAIELEQFTVFYQPIIELNTGRTRGVEALVRWNHPEKGMVSPITFIPLAEESGLIVPLGRWVLKRACRDARRWQMAQQFPGQQSIYLTVNLSARQLQDPCLIRDVEQVLREENFDPRLLVLEITESMFVNDPTAARAVLEQFRQMGIRLALDDFGTGYSSLSYLQRFPLDLLKLDKEFVNTLDQEGADNKLTKAIVSLGQTLELTTVAEGIERPTQVEALRFLKCELGQGYHFARPMPAEDLESFLVVQNGIAIPAAAVQAMA